jgi:alcohol dehydrogenase class IV
MKNFLFKSPTKIVFGENEALKIHIICSQLGLKKLFIVTDKVIEETIPFRNFSEALKTAGFDTVVYSDTVVDPPVDVVDRIARILKDSGCDAVIAVGGGSPIDTAKAITMLASNRGSIKEYLFGGTRTVNNRSLPLIAVPTTAGSGSEVTSASVITDTENDIKLSVTHEYLAPLYTVVDPVMQKGMPPFITATTGIDALTHALEAYVSLNASPVSDAYAEKAMAMIAENIRTATFNPENLEARSNMAIASVMAAVAFSNGGLGAVHGISQAMGGVAHVAHGLANSLMLPFVMEKNVAGNIKKFAKIAELLGERTEGLSIREQADLSIKAVVRLVRDLRIPEKLSEVKVTREMFPSIVRGTMEYRLLAVNPVRIREQDVYEILEKAF